MNECLKGQDLFVVLQSSEDVPVRKLRESRPSFSIYEVKESFVRTVWNFITLH